MSESFSRHLVDPELLPMLDAFPTAVLTEAMLPGMRGRASWFPADPKDAERTDQVRRLIPGRAGDPDVEVLIYRPRGVEGALPCILHIHGGGYVSGRADGNEAVHRPMAADLGCVIVTVAYRLAPETRFPGAVEDCYAALAWTLANTAELGVDPGRAEIPQRRAAVAVQRHLEHAILAPQANEGEPVLIVL